MSWSIHFYDEGVEDNIQKWPMGIKAKFYWILELITEHGPKETGMPHVKSFGRGLFEIRANGKEGIGRAIFCLFKERKIIILNGFIKKTQKTPRKEIELATKRMREVKDE